MTTDSGNGVDEAPETDDARADEGQALAETAAHVEPEARAAVEDEAHEEATPAAEAEHDEAAAAPGGPAAEPAPAADSERTARAAAPELEAEEATSAPDLEADEAATAVSEPPRPAPVTEAPPPPAPVELLAEPELPPADLVPVPMAGRAPRVLPEPKVHELAPDAGPVLAETRVTLRGEHLHRESIVRIDGLIAMTVGAVEPRELSVRTPPRATPGAVDVTVQNPGAPTLVLAGAYRYEALPPPEITGVAPRRGAVKGGTEISVNGQGFVAGSVVLVDGVRSKTVFVDARTLEARTPPGKAGAMVDVAVENPDGKRAVEPRAFAYDERYR
jgi:hypothetical protein